MTTQHSGTESATSSDLTTTAAVIKHNPALMSDEMLERTFAAREDVLADLVHRVRQNSGRENVQHYLLVGPRGIGKTTLLRLLALRVCEDPDLSREWLPVVFAEEEFSIYDLKDFFLTVLERMGADTTEARHTTASLAARDATAALETAIEAVEQAIERDGRRLLLLIDNFDQVLEQVTSTDDLASHRLRSLLQHDPRYMLVGTTTAIFEELVNYERPLYQFFAPVYLRSLDDKGVRELLRRRAEAEGGGPFLKPSPELSRKVRVITAITGGSPRLVVALYDVLTGRPVLEVMEALTRLMDELTPFYKARIEALPAQQRKLLDTLVRLGGNASPSDLVEATGLKPNLVSTQLIRLRDAGWLQPRAGANRRSTRYGLSEQLFRIWYQMRYTPDGRRRFAFLVDFYRLFYSAPELRQLSEVLISEMHQLHINSMATGHDETGTLLGPTSYDLSIHFTTVLDALPDFREREEFRWRHVIDLIEQHQVDEAERFVRSSRTVHDDRPITVATATDELMFGHFLHHSGHLIRAETAYRRSLQLIPDQVEVLGNLGNILSITDRQREAEDVYRRALELRPNDAGTYYNLAAMLEPIGRLEEAEAAYRRALELQPDDPMSLNNLGVLLQRTDRLDEAIYLFRRALDLRPDAPATLNNLGIVLERTKKLDEAEMTLRRALTLSPDDPAALNNLGLILESTDRKEEAIAVVQNAYGNALARKSPHLPTIRRSYALLLATIVPRQSGQSQIARFINTAELIIQVMEELDAEEQENILFRYLLTIIHEQTSEDLFTAVGELIVQALPGMSEDLELFRLAHRVRVAGDRSALATLDEDTRRAVESLLEPDDPSDDEEAEAASRTN